LQAWKKSAQSEQAGGSQHVDQRKYQHKIAVVLFREQAHCNDKQQDKNDQCDDRTA
jgi:Spy/CpxP family protein refolding chaperone